VRAMGLRRLRRLILAHLPQMNPKLSPRLPTIPGTGNLKPVEDRIDAVLCAFIAANWWYWTVERNILYGDSKSGYIVVPLASARRSTSG
jgi:predicted RNase H-like nuclease